MNISGKVWGTTSKIFNANNVEIHRIVGQKGGKSSTHMHANKRSMFYVEQGSLNIVVEKNNYDLIDTTTLTSGQSTIIEPEEYHRFEVIEDNTVAYEIYWVELDPNDIVRRDVGS